MKRVEARLQRFKFIQDESFEPQAVSKIKASKRGLILVLDTELAAWLSYTTCPALVRNPENWGKLCVGADQGVAAIYIQEKSDRTATLDYDGWFQIG